jgi:hypothetical protein
MTHKKIDVILLLCLILTLSVVSVAQAAPPRQEGATDSTLGETLDLDNGGDTEPLGKNNLGTIMSDQKDGDTLAEDTPTDGTTDEEMPDDGSIGTDPADDGAPENDNTGDTPLDGTEPVAKEHPVASAIAEYFGVTYDEIMSLHEAGNGFGNIAKAYFFADKMDPPLTPEELLEAAHGTGWGNVLKENKIHPGSVGNGNGHRPESGGPGDDGPPGQAKKGNNLTAPAGSDLVGQSGNNGNGKGNNGNGGNHGNGHGNQGGGKGNNKK